LVGSLTELTHDEIARRAYQFYEERAPEQVSTGVDRVIESGQPSPLITA